MLTPQEVSERAFQKASFGGYNMGQVDEFLDLLTADYTALYNENAVLKNKMKVLVEKVDEYRSTEEAMRKALMTAQKLAEDMVRQAEEKSKSIVANAETDARARAEELYQAIEAEQYRLTAAQKSTAAYVARVRAVHEKELEYLAQLHELTPAEEPPAPVDEVAATVSEIDDNVQRLLAQAMAEAAVEQQREQKLAEAMQPVQPVQPAQEPEKQQDLSDTAEFIPVTQAQIQAQAQSQAQAEQPVELPQQPQPAKPEEAPQPEAAGKRRFGHIDFGNLQFGRDYEIK